MTEIIGYSKDGPTDQWGARLQTPGVEGSPEIAAHSSALGAVGGSKGAPLMREYTGRIQLVDLAAYGAPAKSIGYHYPDLFFGSAAPSNIQG